MNKSTRPAVSLRAEDHAASSVSTIEPADAPSCGQDWRPRDLDVWEAGRLLNQTRFWMTQNILALNQKSTAETTRVFHDLALRVRGLVPTVDAMDQLRDDVLKELSDWEDMRGEEHWDLLSEGAEAMARGADVKDAYAPLLHVVNQFHMGLRTRIERDLHERDPDDRGARILRLAEFVDQGLRPPTIYEEMIDSHGTEGPYDPLAPTANRHGPRPESIRETTAACPGPSWLKEIRRRCREIGMHDVDLPPLPSERADVDVRRLVEAAADAICKALATDPAGEPEPDERERTARPPLKGLLRRTDKQWNVEFQGGSLFAVGDLRGLHYLQELLIHPERPFQAHDLLNVVEGQSTDRSSRSHRGAEGLRSSSAPGDVSTAVDAGEVMDKQGLRAIHRRLEEIEQEMEKAQDFNDEATGALERERDEILNEVNRICGPHGVKRLQRKPKNDQDKVAKAINRAIEALESNDPSLGRHLLNSVRTSPHFEYRPETTIEWSV